MPSFGESWSSVPEVCDPSFAKHRNLKVSFSGMKRLSPQIVGLLCLTFWPLGAAADTYPRQPAVDALHYTFHVTLTDGTDELIGGTTIDLRFTDDGVAEVVLDLASAANGKGMTVTEVTSRGAKVPFAHQADRLALTVTPASRAGERRQYTVSYNGTSVQMGPHLCRGGVGAPPTILRIYWYKDDATKKLVVGHVGRKLRDESNPN